MDTLQQYSETAIIHILKKSQSNQVISESMTSESYDILNFGFYFRTKDREANYLSALMVFQYTSIIDARHSVGINCHQIIVPFI